MKRTNLTVMALCAMLLGAGAAQAGQNQQQNNTQLFPATGQTTVYAVGDDGYYQAGASLRYKNNGNGTITDQNTGLMWEVKSEDGGLHDVNNIYDWSGNCSSSGNPCGTAADCLPTVAGQTCNSGFGTIFQWVAQLNANNFAGHHDWRIPNVKELQSIVDYGTLSPLPASPPPAVAAAFNTNCTAPYTVTTCSVTAYAFYWSATTYALGPSLAWGVSFSDGTVGTDNKTLDHVRAVRSGL